MPNQEFLLEALADFIALGRAVGLAKVVQPLETFEAEFQTSKRIPKAVLVRLDNLAGRAFVAIREKVYDMAKDKPRAGMKKHDAELHRSFRALQDAIYAPAKSESAETMVAGLAGNKESTSVLGDPKAAKEIARQGLEAVRRFSQAVFRRDLGTAYGLCANEYRVNRSEKEFFNDLHAADRQFGGPATGLLVERITWIYADEASRKRSNSNGDWPKDTPKPNKRALVGAFWFADKEKKLGRSAFFWVTEENDGYRIAKFKQYLQ